MTTPACGRLVELSHQIVDGDVGFPGLPAPRVRPHRSHQDSAGRYADGSTFEISHLSLVGNSGTYLDSPAHRFPGRGDVASIGLERLVDRPAVLVDVRDESPHPIDFEVAGDMAGVAVPIRTGWDRRRGTAAYWEPGPFLSTASAHALAQVGPAVVGVDFWNVDDVRGTARPVHAALLETGIPIIEDLTGLSALPGHGALFSAVPLAVAGGVSMPVRAWARLPE